MKLTSLLENETAQRWITDPAKIVEYIKAARLGEKDDYQINKDGTVDFSLTSFLVLTHLAHSIRMKGLHIFLTQSH